jgi:drug/metabolite transporter (DMT)-like permease
MKRSVHSRINPALSMVLAAFFFATLGAIIKYLKHLPTWEIVFVRSFVNLIWCFPSGVREFPKQWRKEFWALLLRGVSGCASMVLYFYAIEHIKLADAVMLNNASPILVLILSAIFLKEKLSSKSVVCVLVAFIGVSFIIKPQFLLHGLDSRDLGALAGFASIFAAGIAYVSIKFATRYLTPNFIVFSFALVSSLMALGPMLMNFVQPTPVEWLLLILGGLLAALAQLAMTHGYAKLPASTASPLMLIMVFFSAAYGWFFWGEMPDKWSFFGSLLVVGGLIGAYRWRN